MAGRTFAIGDIHGDLEHLEALFGILPALDAGDTIVFIGDFVDRGPDSAGVVRFVRELPARTPARVVALRGNHEDAWLRVRREGWYEFVLPEGNGCLATLRSFRGEPPPKRHENPTREEFEAMGKGTFLPDDVVAWMESLPIWYEDEHAIYVHAGLPWDGERWVHPSEVPNPKFLVWDRSRTFWEQYQGKRVVFGHTVVEELPQSKSTYTPDEVHDAYITPTLAGIDTRAGHGGFLTALELPSVVLHESCSVIPPSLNRHKHGH